MVSIWSGSLISSESHCNESIWVIFPFALCIFRKYLVPRSPSWYHFDCRQLLRNSPFSFSILFLLQINSSSRSIAISLNKSDAAVSIDRCQKSISFLKVFISNSCAFLWFEEISIAIDLIAIFKNSNIWWGFICVSLIWSNLLFSSVINFCFNITLLMKKVSSLTILSWVSFAKFFNFTMTAQWSDWVYVQSVCTL